MIRRRYVIFLLVIGVITIISVVGRRELWKVEREQLCRRHLQNLKALIEMYANGNHSRFPPDLEVAIREEDQGRWLLVCPAVAADLNYNPPPGYCDYTFLDLPAFTDRLPPQAEPSQPVWWRKEIDTYPMVFERHLHNRLGIGVHVILVDGTLMWDPEARWLKRFASRHPEIAFPLPQ